MNPEEIEERLEHVRDAYGGDRPDPEEGHILEDDLLWDFVRATAEGEVEDPREAARRLLDLDEEDRQRWFA